jgi:1-acyl-sn-glycerol-3-phosphate acyltransferase
MFRNRLYTILTVPAFGLLYLFTAVMVIIIYCFALLKLKRLVVRLLGFWARTVFIIIGKKLNIHGKENIRRDGKYILIANHTSLFDIMAIMSIYPGVSWLGHKRLLKIPVFRRVLKMTGYVPMRKTNYVNTKNMIDQLLKKSSAHTIAMFPEGTRTTDGKINKFYRGFIHLLRASDINILPVTLKGFYLLKPKTRFHIKFNSKIDVIIHEPIDRESLINKTDEEIISIVKNIIESSLEN